MRPDDNERKQETRLPARVEQALARARAKVNEGAPAADNRGRWLALIPVSIALLGFLLFVPRSAEPQAVPLPYVDVRALAAVERADDALAAEAEKNRLPTDILAVGSAIRAMHAALTASTRDEQTISAARANLDASVQHASAARPDVQQKLLALRAVQMKKFLDEVERYEKTGKVTTELAEISGGFVERNTVAGWIDGKRVHMTPSQRRVAFKLVWNAMTNVDPLPAFAPTLDEQRTLYVLYLTRPHPPEPRRLEVEVERRDAKTLADCERVARNERRFTEMWRAEKIQRLGQIDPSYPTSYALGVAYYRAGRYDLASDAFRAYLDAHPDGPYVARARNHLKAALEAYRTI